MTSYSSAPRRYRIIDGEERQPQQSDEQHHGADDDGDYCDSGRFAATLKP
jgi:hypothetical protein